MSKKVWTIEDAESLFHKPLFELLFEAQKVHRENFDPTKIQVSRLLSIKTGKCSEDCKYCSQSVRYDTGLDAEKLMSNENVSARPTTCLISERFSYNSVDTGLSGFYG